MYVTDSTSLECERVNSSQESNECECPSNSWVQYKYGNMITELTYTLLYDDDGKLIITRTVLVQKVRVDRTVLVPYPVVYCKLAGYNRK